MGSREEAVEALEAAHGSAEINVGNVLLLVPI